MGLVNEQEADEEEDDDKFDDAYGLNHLDDEVLFAKQSKKKKKKTKQQQIEEEWTEERRKLSRRHTRQRTAQKLKIQKLIEAKMRYVSSNSIFDEKYGK